MNGLGIVGEGRKEMGENTGMGRGTRKKGNSKRGKEEKGRGNWREKELT